MRWAKELGDVIGSGSQMQTPETKKLSWLQLFGCRRSRTTGGLIENEWGMKKWEPSLIPVALFSPFSLLATYRG